MLDRRNRHEQFRFLHFTRDRLLWPKRQRWHIDSATRPRCRLRRHREKPRIDIHERFHDPLQQLSVMRSKDHSVARPSETDVQKAKYLLPRILDTRSVLGALYHP